MEQAAIKRCLTSAFTLVELAIILVIIGLLVAGVLQGKELIEQAKIRKQIRQISDLDTSLNTFRSKYSCLPGDCLKATKFFGTTDPSGNTISDGDGDGLIREKTSPADECLNPDIVGEVVNLFLHLNLAGIGNYAVSASGIGLPGKNYPTSAFDNSTGIFISCMSTSANPTATPTFLKNGNIIIMGASGSIGFGSGGRIGYATGQFGVLHYGGFGNRNGAPLTPIGIPSDVISQIDQKIDDSVPSSGIFGIIAGQSGCGANLAAYPSNSPNCMATAGKRIN